MKHIHLWGVKQNNLKNLEIKIPLGKMTVICGPSGSGKSSLAFETLFAEGQRRFIESMSNYSRQFLNKAPKPDIEGISNIPPAIAIQQKNNTRSSRSTVGTTTEIIDYLRLLFEKLGVFYCPTHHIPVLKYSAGSGSEYILKHWENKRGYIICSLDVRNLTISQSKELMAALIRDGILRIAIPPKQESSHQKAQKKAKSKNSSIGNIQNLENSCKDFSKYTVEELASEIFLKKGLPKELIYLVIDRLVFSAENKGRLTDSLTLAQGIYRKLHSSHSYARIHATVLEGEIIQMSEQATCLYCDWQAPTLSSSFFSFNSPIGACAHCKGFGNILTLDPSKVIPDPTLSIEEGAIHPFTMPSAADDLKDLLLFCRRNKIPVNIPWENLSEDLKKLLWRGDNKFWGINGLFEYLETKKYKMHIRVFLARYRSPSLCPECQGSRLRKECNLVLFKGKTINDLTKMTVKDLANFMNGLELNSYEENVASEILRQLRNRLDFLMRVGVHYINVNRETRTLSGGEFQRLILANQLGMGLSQVLYVLDEPTIGLHPRDNYRLISVMKSIQELGNTLVIVEHDHDVIKSSQEVIELGPGSGSLGGEIMYCGPTEDFLVSKKSLTAQFINKPLAFEDLNTGKTSRPVTTSDHRFSLELKGITGNNLKNIDVKIPLNRLVAVTGVSGSGKSSLITKTLYPALAAHLKIEFLPSLTHKSISGLDHIKNVVLIDQKSIGRSARSSPITYMKAFDGIRNIMAQTLEAKSRGYTPGTFSLNVDGGRCPACKGTGSEEIDMMFMDNIVLPCDLCDGKKFRPEILEVTFQGKNISEILNLTVKEAMDFFISNPQIRKPLTLLKSVGLEYLTIGQSASSLSGGEAQRLKIAQELSQAKLNSSVYILDEPTTGLHFREIKMLIDVLHKLIDVGASVVVIEHNMDVIAGCDYVIDMGPEGGDEGGQVVFSGSPSDLLNHPGSLTGNYLKEYLKAKS